MSPLGTGSGTEGEELSIRNRVILGDRLRKRLQRLVEEARASFGEHPGHRTSIQFRSKEAFCIRGEASLRSPLRTSLVA